MFGNSKRDATLKDLKERVEQLEADCAPFRIGEIRSAYALFNDNRPRLSLHQVAQKIMDHCGLEFHKVPSTGGHIAVRKKLDPLAFVQSGSNALGEVLKKKAPPKRKKRSR